MKKENFERLKQSLEQAIAYERGEAKAGRITVQPRPVKKRRINITLDEDIVEHIKRRAAPPNAAPYQTQINEVLREAVERTEPAAVPEARIEEMAERIAAKVAIRLRRGMKRKAA